MVTLQCLKRYSKQFKLDSEILTPQDLALRFPLQPRPMKLKKGSGFLNGSWRHVRNHEILRVQVAVVWVSSFPRQKTKKQVDKAMRSSSKQNKNKALRYWSDVIRHQSFITRSTLLSVTKAGNLKIDFTANIASEFTFLVWKHFDATEIPKPK